MKAASVWILGALLCAAVLVMWVEGRWINPSLFQGGVFLLSAGWAIQAIWRPSRVAGGAAFLVALAALGGAVVWGMVQLARGQTVSRWDTLMAVVTWGANFAAFFVAGQIGAGSGGRRRLQYWMLVFAFGISVVSVLQHFSAPGEMLWFYEVGGDAFGPFISRDRYAAFAELVFPLAMVEAFGQGRMARFSLGVCATLFAAVIAGASRTGSFLIAVEAVAVLALAGREGGFARGRVRRTAWKFAAAAGIFTAVVGAGVLVARYTDLDISDRMAFWRSSVEMVRARPVFGFGLGNFENAYAGYAVIDMNKIVNHAHNDWAEWAADGGLPFLGLMVVFAGAVGWKAWKSVWGIGVLTVLVHSLVDFPLQNPAVEFWFFAVAGAVMGERRERRGSRSGRDAAGMPAGRGVPVVRGLEPLVQ